MNDTEKQKKLLVDALANLKPRQLHRTLFNLADTYNQAAELSLGKITSTGNADFCAPAIMCRSFAVELLLKFFIVSSHPPQIGKAELDALGVSLYGHPYSSLFDRIDTAQQISIAAVHSSRTSASVTPAAFRAILVSLGDKPFVDWRYVYELSGTKHFDIQLLSMVADSLGLAAQEVTRKLAPASD